LANIESSRLQTPVGAAISSEWEVAAQTWWLARSNVTRKVLWVALNGFCAFCLFAFLSFKGVFDTDRNTHFQIGFLDPWLVIESNQGYGKRSESGIFLGWSWLFGIGAYGSGWLLFKLRRTPDTPKSANDAEAVAAQSSSAPSHVPETGVLSRIIVAAGIVTMLSGVLMILLLSGAFVDRYSFDAFFLQDAVQIPLFVTQTLAIPMGILMMISGLAMRSGAAGPARLGAILGAIPLTPGWLITLPLSLYVLVSAKTGTGPDSFPRAKDASSLSSEPRLSRCALVGAIWAPLFFMAFLMTFVSMRSTSYAQGEYTGPSPLQLVLMFTLLPLGVLAPFGTTILGAVTIAKIKHSGGMLYGLRLAAADMLFFPLLILFGAISVGLALALHSVFPIQMVVAGVLASIVASIVCFFVGRAAWRAIHPIGVPVVRERSASAWSVLEIVTAVAVVITFVMAAVKGIYELAQRPSPLDVVAVPVTALAALAAGVLLVVHQIHRPSGSRTALPELFIAVLAACAGSLSWTAVFSPIAGWNFWQGAVFASLNFVLSLFLLIVGNSRPRTRAIITLLVGLIGFALVMWFNVGPVGVIGGSEFLTTITRKPGLPGMFIAAALGLLAMIAGALQLRNRMNGADDSNASPPGASTKP
jgi:hypothetical protein